MSIAFGPSLRWRQVFRGVFFCDGRFVFVLAVFGLALFPARVFGAFGVTSSGGFYTVGTGGGLVFKVNQANGDVTSLNFNGTEYQATDKNTHIASGLGSATVTATTYGSSYIKITVNSGANNTVVTNLTNYLMVRNGDPVIYLATYVVNEPSVAVLMPGELAVLFALMKL